MSLGCFCKPPSTSQRQSLQNRKELPTCGPRKDQNAQGLIRSRLIRSLGPQGDIPTRPEPSHSSQTHVPNKRVPLLNLQPCAAPDFLPPMKPHLPSFPQLASSQPSLGSTQNISLPSALLSLLAFLENPLPPGIFFLLLPTTTMGGEGVSGTSRENHCFSRFLTAALDHFSPIILTQNLSSLQTPPRLLTLRRCCCRTAG